MSTSSISPQAIAAELEDTWSPRVVAAFDEHYVKVARLHGTFTWHCHEDEDELFYVLSGCLTIELEDRTVVLKPGDLYVVPRGVMHNPIAEEECQVMLIERRSTLHTGGKVTAQTRSLEEQLP
ncbi:MAG: cupin domain-containing protein [Pseudomonadota bacterium]